MKLLESAGTILLAWAALVVVQVIAGIIVPLNAPSVPHVFLWLMAVDLIMVTVLGFAGMRSDWRGLKLGLALSAIPFGIAAVNAVEGAVFLTKSEINWQRLMVNIFVAYALATPLWMLIFGRGEQAMPAHYCPVQHRSAGGMLWRLVVSDFSYLFLYFLAGMIIFPFVREFYATQTVPPPGKIVALQLLLRGPVFIGICLLIVRMLGLRRAIGALAWARCLRP